MRSQLRGLVLPGFWILIFGGRRLSSVIASRLYSGSAGVVNAILRHALR